MFDLEKQITGWRQEMTRAGIRRAELLDELETHLREQMERLRPEERNEAAFQVAVKQLGDGKTLKPEFAKVKRKWFPADNSRALNLLGGWFICMGVNAIYLHVACNVWILSQSGWHVTWKPYGRLCAALAMLLTLQLFVGWGLLRRSNFCRICAFPMAILGAGFVVLDLLAHAFHDLFSYSGGYRFFLEWVIFHHCEWLCDLLKLGILIWGCWYLSQPTVRTLFRADPKTQTA